MNALAGVPLCHFPKVREVLLTALMAIEQWQCENIYLKHFNMTLAKCYKDRI